MSVQQWFINFELNAEAYGLNDKQKYVQARAGFDPQVIWFS